jgi:uncharacterized protein
VRKKIIIVSVLSLLTFILLALGGLGFYLSEQLLKFKINKVPKDIIKLADTKKDTAVAVLSTVVEQFSSSEITIPSDFGYNLAGNYFPSTNGGEDTIIIAHGVGGGRKGSPEYVKLFLELGFNVITYDQRHHGNSGGDNISYGYYESYDMKKVVDYSKNISVGNTGVFGISMGASTTLMYAGVVEDGADFYIVDAAYSNFYEEALYRLDRDFSYIPHWSIDFVGNLTDLFVRVRAGFSLKDVNPLKHIENINSPIMFINTKEDMFIPPYMTEKLYEKKTGDKYLYLVERGNHGQALAENPEKYRDEIYNFLKKYILREKI